MTQYIGGRFQPGYKSDVELYEGMVAARRQMLVEHLEKAAEDMARNARRSLLYKAIEKTNEHRRRMEGGGH